MTTFQIFLICFISSVTLSAIVAQICTTYLIAKGKHPTYSKLVEEKKE